MKIYDLKPGSFFTMQSDIDDEISQYYVRVKSEYPPADGYVSFGYDQSDDSFQWNGQLFSFDFIDKNTECVPVELEIKAKGN